MCLVSIELMKCAILIILDSRRLGLGPWTALSIDRDYDPADNVNVSRLTFVRFYCTITTMIRVVL